MNSKAAKHTSVLLFSFFLFFGIAFLSSCKEEKKAPEGRQPYVIPDSLLKTLNIDTVAQCQLEDAVTLTGDVDFDQDKVVRIYPLVSGNVQGITAALGDYVQKGQTLGIIKSTEIAGYGSDLINAQTNLSVAEKNLQKTKDLYRSGLASQPDSLAAEVSYQQAKSELGRVQQVLNISGASNGNDVIKSPINGFVVEKLVTNNQAIRTDNGGNLFTISDLHDVWVWANVYEANINKIHQGDNVDITTIAYPGRVFHGRVDKTLNMLDSSTKTMKVKIVLDNPEYALKPQMFVSITSTNKENTQAICIPASALVYDNSQYFVLVYKSNAQVMITHVDLINKVGDKAYVSSGVQPGQQVIASQALLIYNQLND